MTKFISAVVLAVALSFSAVSTAAAENTNVLQVGAKSAPKLVQRNGRTCVVTYHVDGLEGTFASSGDAIAAAARANVVINWTTRTSCL